MEAFNQLAKNIRYLRKTHKLSQQKLATALSIKRSNIAAYETKNVEPRLNLINRMADYFNVSLADLICSDLEQQNPKRTDTLPDGTFFYERGRATPAPNLGNMETLENFRRESEKIRKMLEGFRIFYQYKKDIVNNNNAAEKRRIHADVENFIIFIEHILQYNESIIHLLDRSMPTVEDGEEKMSGELPPPTTTRRIPPAAAVEGVSSIGEGA